MAKSKAQWLTAAEVAKLIGCSSQHLGRLRKDGSFKRGVHYKEIGRKLAMRPTYRYNLTAIMRDLG